MTFESLGLPARMTARLAEIGLTEPTPIQRDAIPHAVAGRDVLGLAQTGTGKTAAFGLPLIQMLGARNMRAAPKSVCALILAPTRELANQITDSLRAFGGGRGGPRVGTVVGGKSINAQAQMLARGTEVLVATPGRLIDLLDRRAVTLDKAAFLVLDEADHMLDMGFIHALRRIAPLLPAGRQTMLFSATMPKQLEEIAADYLTDPVKVQVSPPGKPADKVEQEVHFVAKDAKQGLLIELLDGHRDERALVFARTKHGAERLMKSLEAQGFAAASIHGNKSQGQRDRALAAFREGELKVLVATDVAARGIDIPGVGYVYNYDLPDVPESYVHRIGRTARAGADGRAVAFCAAGEMGELKQIQKLLGKQIEVASGTPWTGPVPEDEKPKQRGRGGRPQGKPAGKPQARQGQPRKAAQAKPAQGKPGGARRRSRRRPAKQAA